MNKTEELLHVINTTCELYEEDILLQVHREITGQVKNDITLAEARQEILNYEYEGKTGYDCGWSRIEFNNKFIQAQLDTIMNLDINLSEFKCIRNEKNFYLNKECICCTLPNYPLNVQSTTIKDLVNKLVMYIVQTTTNKLDGIDYSICYTLD